MQGGKGGGASAGPLRGLGAPLAPLGLAPAVIQAVWGGAVAETHLGLGLLRVGIQGGEARTMMTGQVSCHPAVNNPPPAFPILG